MGESTRLFESAGRAAAVLGMAALIPIYSDLPPQPVNTLDKMPRSSVFVRNGENAALEKAKIAGLRFLDLQARIRGWSEEKTGKYKEKYIARVEKIFDAAYSEISRKPSGREETLKLCEIVSNAVHEATTDKKMLEFEDEGIRLSKKGMKLPEINSTLEGKWRVEIEAIEKKALDNGNGALGESLEADTYDCDMTALMFGEVMKAYGVECSLVTFFFHAMPMVKLGDGEEIFLESTTNVALAGIFGLKFMKTRKEAEAAYGKIVSMVPLAELEKSQYATLVILNGIKDRKERGGRIMEFYESLKGKNIRPDDLMLYSAINTYLVSGKFEKGEALGREMRADSTRQFLSYDDYGLCLREEGKAEEAAEAFAEGIGVFGKKIHAGGQVPQLVHIYREKLAVVANCLSELHFKKGERGKALQYGELAYNTYPDKERAALLAEMYYAFGDSKKSMEYVRTAMEDGQGDARIEMLLGLMCNDRGETENAVMHLKKAASLDASSEIPRMRLATVYAKNGDYEGANKELDRADSINPNSFEIFLLRAKVMIARGNPKEAAEMLIGKGKERKIFESEYFRTLALAQNAAGFPVAAVKTLDAGIGINKSDYELYFTRGIVNAEAGFLGTAAKDLEKVLELNPGHMEAYDTLVKIYSARGQEEDALDVEKRKNEQLKKMESGNPGR